MTTRTGRLAMALMMTALFLGYTGVALAQVGSGTLKNPNLAGEEELLTLPHLDAALAAGLIEGRPWMSMRDVDAFLGKSLTEEQRAELYTKLFLPINLNTASREEILLIPGVGPRMAHEFEEYRPYKHLAQFRREIGKYVDEKEVARLERYVTLD